MNLEHEIDSHQIDRIIGFLKDGFEGFTLNESIDRKFFTFLMLDFEKLDIEEELKQFQAWTLDQKDHGRQLNRNHSFYAC